jgi:alpha-glucosidase
MEYIFLDHDCLIFDAIYSDESQNFVSEIDLKKNMSFKIKIRTAKENVDKIFLVTADNTNNKTNKFDMQKDHSNDFFDFYIIKIDGQTENFIYYFEIIKNNKKYFYNKFGICERVDNNYNFCLTPGFVAPDWAKSCVIYQIFVDRFFNGDANNDVIDNEYLYLGHSAKKINWEEKIKINDVCNFYGGDLKGIIKKMDYLVDLGIEAIYLNPIFVSPSTHKYDIQDYDYIDPHFGKIVKDNGERLYFENFNNKFASKYISRTCDKENLEASNNLFIKLVEIAHKNNIKIILDGVFNHCGAFNKWLDKENFYYKSGYAIGAYKDKNSIYNNYFHWHKDDWPNNNFYDSWWGFDNHPKLNYENSKELFNYILKIAQKWVSAPFNADGWRIDVAADLGMSREFNHKFWREFRLAVKKVNPEAIIIAEHYGNAKEWLSGDQWDSIMNYDAFMEPVTYFLTGMEKHSESFDACKLNNSNYFEQCIKFNMAQFNFNNLIMSMNQLSNHDHSRFYTRTNKIVGRLHNKGHSASEENVNKSIMMQGIIFQMTWPGCPSIYYGDEVGLKGWSDPDNRRPFPWDNQDKILLEFYKFLIDFHKKNCALKFGSLMFLNIEPGIICYARWLEDINERIIIMLNTNDQKYNLKIPVWKIGLLKNNKFKKIISVSDNHFKTNHKNLLYCDKVLNIEINSHSAIIIKSV